MYSFNSKSSKNKNNWLKNILIDNSDESDDDIEQSVQELLKIRKSYKNKQPDWSTKPTNKLNSNLSSTILSLNDSVPLNSLFKNDKQFKCKKQKTTSRKKLKSESGLQIKFTKFIISVYCLIIKFFSLFLS